jgi:hypothetical protein
MELQPGPQGIAAAGPVGVDHSMGFQLGPNGSQLPTGPQGIAAAGHGLQTSAYFRPWDPGLCIMPAHGSRELHRVPARRGSQLLARSALITRSNSNQVPMGSNCQPARRGSQLLARSALITRWDSNQVPMNPGLCILLAMGSSVVHHAGPCIHQGDCIEYRPAGDCIMLARLGVDRFADVRSCWPWDPRLCILLALGSI